MAVFLGHHASDEACDDDGELIINLYFNGYMPRTHGYALCGQRCYGKHDWGAKGRTNVIGVLLSEEERSIVSAWNNRGLNF